MKEKGFSLPLIFQSLFIMQKRIGRFAEIILGKAKKIIDVRL